MTDFLASDWSLWPVIVWVPAMLLWRLAVARRRRDEDQAWGDRFRQIADEGGREEGMRAVAMFIEREDRDHQRRRFDLLLLAISAGMVILAAVRLPFV